MRMPAALRGLLLRPLTTQLDDGAAAFRHQGDRANLRLMQENDLMAGEQLLAELRVHWLRFATLGHLLGIFLTLGLWLLVIWAIKASRTLTLTNRRIVLRRGLLSRDEYSMDLRRLTQSRVTQGLFQRLWGVGTIAFTEVDAEGIVFGPIADPARVRKLAEEAAFALGSPALQAVSAK